MKDSAEGMTNSAAESGAAACDDGLALAIAENAFYKRRERPTDEEIEAMVATLRSFADAYPESVFGPVTKEEIAQHASLITRNSAAMGRHCAQFMVQAAAMIERLAAIKKAKGA